MKVSLFFTGGLVKFVFYSILWLNKFVWKCDSLLTLYFAEVDLKKSDIWTGGLYLTLLMQFLENKIAVELTRSEFVQAREVVYYLLSSLSYKLSRYVIQQKLWVPKKVYVWYVYLSYNNWTYFDNYSWWLVCIPIRLIYA